MISLHQRNWTPKEIVELLDYYHKLPDVNNKNKVIRMAQHKFKRPKFIRKQFNGFLKNKAQIRISATTVGSDIQKQGIKWQKVGMYDQMENILASRIRAIYQGGVVIEMWMVVEDVKYILHKLYPYQFPEPPCEDSPFKFSRGWRVFFSTTQLLFLIVGTKKNIRSVKPDWIAKIQQFHFKTRALLVSEINHPRWVLTVPFYVYTH